MDRSELEQKVDLQNRNSTPLLARKGPGRRFRPSITFRVSLLIATALIGSGFSAYFLVLAPLRSSLDRAEQRRHWNIAGVTASRLEPFLNPAIDYPATGTILAELNRLFPETTIFVLHEDGSIALSLVEPGAAFSQQIDPGPIHHFLEASPEDSDVVYSVHPSRPQRLALLSAARVRIAGQPGYVAALTDPWPFTMYLQSAFKFGNPPLLMVVLASALSAAVFAGLLLLAALSRRFRRVVTVAERISAGEYDARVDDSQADEISVIGHALDGMAEALVHNIRELERKDGLRRQLIADISHDLRGPIASLKATLEAVTEKFDRLSPEERRAFLDSSTKNIDGLGQLVGSLFELAKLEARETVPRFESIPVADFLRGILDRFRPLALQHRIDLTGELGGGDSYVWADGAMLERIFGNLLENALRFTPEGGRIRIAANHATPDTVRFVVEDSGSGISEERTAEIFARFHTDPSGSRESTAGIGTGLGLAIVQKFIESLGSKIEVESGAGTGSSFTFSLRRPPPSHSPRTESARR